MKQFLNLFGCIIVMCLTTNFTALSQPVSQTFNSSGTYTIPTGYSANVTIEVIGGGGGGGAYSSNGGGGGGGGGYASVTILLTEGSYPVTVGAAGSPGSSGGTSSFTSLAVANGGSAGSSGSVSGGGAGGSGGSGTTGTTTHSGGNGASGGNFFGTYGGGGGGGAGSTGNGSSTTSGFGAGGNSPGESGGNGGYFIFGGTAPVNGASPGGGGGGAATPSSSIGAFGGNGVVIVTVNTVLPVTLVKFEATSHNANVLLEWATASEVNNQGFFVEVSEDGIHYTEVDFVPGKGWSNQLVAYTYTHKDALKHKGQLYYRLHQVDFDGANDYSDVITVHLNKRELPLSLYPNPSNGDFNVYIPLSIESAHIIIYDINGKGVYNTQLKQGVNEVWFEATPGVYNALVTTDFETSYYRIVLE